MKEKFGTKEGFEICPHQFSHLLIPPPPGTVRRRTQSRIACHLQRLCQSRSLNARPASFAPPLHVLYPEAKWNACRPVRTLHNYTSISTVHDSPRLLLSSAFLCAVSCQEAQACSSSTRRLPFALQSCLHWDLEMQTGKFPCTGTIYFSVDTFITVCGKTHSVAEAIDTLTPQYSAGHTPLPCW